MHRQKPNDVDSSHHTCNQQSAPEEKSDYPSYCLVDCYRFISLAVVGKTRLYDSPD
jgi:hypothetical protein